MTTFGSNLRFILAAYGVMWIVVLGYLVRLARKGARARASYDVIARDEIEAVR